MQLEMKNIFKSFGANLVLDDVSFTLPEGHIVALLGENGAGKSTLMNILGGVLQADSGKIFLDGEEVTFSSPKESLDRKIAFIHQELNLINDLPIYENLFIGRELRKSNHFLDHEAMIAETKKLFEEMDLDLDPQTMVRDLDASYKQITEISRAMLMDARIVIMDEPTTSLTGSEISRVFTLMRKLRDMGVGIIFISHKLNEVMEICDSYTILRDGHMIRSGLVSETSTKQIASLMVGHEVNEGEKAASSQAGQVVMKAEGLGDGRSFADIDFEIRSGEVVGFTGLLGDGRSELFQAIFGSGSQIRTGQLYLYGNAVKIRSTQQAVRLGIGYVPRNRKENGIVKDLDILTNGSLVTLTRRRKNGFFLDEEQILKDFEAQKKDLHIKMEADTDSILSLSGGNQQKVILARWLSSQPRILILDNPTQGVDVGAKEEIYQIITALAQKGVAVVVLSSESKEITRIASRCYVMYHGRILKELRDQSLNEKTIMQYATGVEE